MIYFILEIFHDFLFQQIHTNHCTWIQRNIKCQCQWIINKQLLHNYKGKSKTVSFPRNDRSKNH